MGNAHDEASAPATAPNHSASTAEGSLVLQNQLSNGKIQANEGRKRRFPLSDKIRGGGHIGSSPSFGYNVSWPLASLSVAPDSLTFSMWPVTYRFEKSSIRCLLKKRLRLWRQMTARPSATVDTNPAFSKSVVFQTRQFPRLESLLSENGYLLNREATTEPIRYSKLIPAITYIAVIVGLIAAVIAIGVVAGSIGRK